MNNSFELARKELGDVRGVARCVEVSQNEHNMDVIDERASIQETAVKQEMVVAVVHENTITLEDTGE